MSAGLLELVARGKKDTFFTGQPKISYFHSVYQRASPWLRETRFIQSQNEGDFGSYVDFMLDPVADFMRDIHLLVDLPTWLPADIATLNTRAVVQDISGSTFGWTRDIGYHLIDKIQLYQNQVLLYEDYGEAMLFRLWSRSRNGALSVAQSVSGGHDGSALSIQRNATPGRLQVRLQLPFDNFPRDFGIPICALQSFTLRLRVFLKPLKQLIECSDRRLEPNPFSKTLRCKTSANGNWREFSTKELSKLGKPSLMLRVQHVYVDSNSQKALKAMSWICSILSAQRNQFTLEDSFWRGALFPIRREVEFYGLCQRLRLVFQTEANFLAGNLSSYSPPTGNHWFSTCSLRIHGYERLGIWEDRVFDLITSYSHDRGQSYPHVYLLDGGAQEQSVPAGTINFAVIEKPEIQLNMFNQDDDSRNASKKTFLRIYADIWRIISISDGLIHIPYS